MLNRLTRRPLSQSETESLVATFARHIFQHIVPERVILFGSAATKQLVAKLPKTVNPPSGYDLSELTVFATIRRYEEGSSQLTSAELESILKIAESMYQWAEKEVVKALP